MTLEEANLQVNISIRTPLFKRDTCIVPIEAIKTILNYIENESIPKEKIKEAIEYEKEIAKEPISSGCTMNQLHGYTARVLEELLGE